MTQVEFFFDVGSPASYLAWTQLPKIVAEAPEVKDRLKAATAEAAERGVFGAPTFFVGDEMWFGQDRLDWVASALRG
jgi:2-hydroxychromene-2-carboxylate isomerase